MSKALEFYLNEESSSKGRENVEIIDKILDFYFDFKEVECIETGVSYGGDDDNFGLYLAKFTSDYGGKMSSVDVLNDRVEQSRNYIISKISNVNYNPVTQDSLEFLREYEGKPNLVHLDSYDLDITNPLPSMLHHWYEFIEVNDKMLSGSILFIDDNFFRGTTVYWNVLDSNKNLVDVIPTEVKHEITGKGALIYHAVKEKKIKDWEILGDHYIAGPNQKLIFRKL